MHHTSKVFICLLLASACSSAVIPNNFKKCNRKSADFSKCLTEAVSDALGQLTSPFKSVGLPNLEPLEIPALAIDAGSGTVSFKQIYKNIKLSGLSRFKCSNVTVDFAKKFMVLDCTSPLVVLDFDYQANGKILLLPIFGHGPGVISLDKLNLNLVVYFKEVSKKGLKHFKIVDRNLTMTPERIHFKLDNLYDGDKMLGDNVLKVLNDNWKDVFADVKPSYEHAFVQIFVAIFGKVLEKVPVQELFGSE